MNKKILKLLVFTLLISLLLSGCKKKNPEDIDGIYINPVFPDDYTYVPEISEELPSVEPFDTDLFMKNKKNNYIPYSPVINLSSGMSWPEGKALPTFSLPADTIYTISTARLPADEKLTFATFQGLVNRDKTEILLAEQGDVDQYTWANTLDLNRENRTNTRYELVNDFKDKIKGLVLYDSKKSAHFRNAASTIANLNSYLPVTETVKGNLEDAGVVFSDSEIIDITSWTETTSIEIYNKIYNEYWGNASRRLLLLCNPGVRDGDGNIQNDLDHCRDIAAAVGAAVIYPNTHSKDETELFEKFVKDMADTDCTSMILGWGMSERSAITASSKYGIGIVPANFYISASVYSGTNHTINIPEVPKRADLENKAYVAVYISDGDNIQYNQRAMRKFWDSERSTRGKVAINWTIAPILADIGPGLMNYYYDNSSAMDCFVSGPSGISYLMPTNTAGSSGGVFLNDKKYSDDFTRLTGQYLYKTGIRTITVWDSAETVVRGSYEEYCRYLYGMTIQQFGSYPLTDSSLENDRLRFEKLIICYSGDYNAFYSDSSYQISRWDREGATAPLFLSYQFDRWNSSASDILNLQNDLQERFPGKVELVRADHYFSYYNEQNNLPFNLTLLSSTNVTSSDQSSEPEKSVDGTPVTIWSSESSDASLQYDFGKEYNISRYVIRHAGDNGYNKVYNTREYTVQVSKDGEKWDTVDVYKENQVNVTDIDIDPVSARYLKIIINNAGADNIARIADVEIYGSRQ